MAEAAGLVLGVLSLASLFTSCVDCFEYVQIAKNFDHDYKIAQLQLDSARLRLSRWGTAAPLADENRFSPEEIIHAKKLLESIIECISASQTATSNLSTSTAIAVYDPKKDLFEASTLHTLMNKLSIKRRRQYTSFSRRQQLKWILYRKNDLDSLISNIVTLLDSLETLFPAHTTAREENVTYEIEEVVDPDNNDDANRRLLAAATKTTDPLLYNSLIGLSPDGHIYEDNRVEEMARALYGDHYLVDGRQHPSAGASRHLFRGNVARGSSRVVYGNQYGGKSIFDD